MSTRSEIEIRNGDYVLHLYHHCDGYLSGVGEELRSKLVYSLGMNTLIKDMSLYDLLVGEVAKDHDYEDEYKLEMNDDNHLHGDIEYLYVIKDCNLYYVNKWELLDLWDLHNKIKTYNDIINYVCKDVNKLDLSKCIHD